MNIVASETDAQGNYISPNGSYDTATDTFTFDITAGLKNVKDVSFTAMVKTAGHELTHFIQNHDEKQYATLKNETLRFLEQKRGPDWINERIKRIIENNREVGTTLTIEEARDELVADSFENVLTEIDFAERILKADKTLFDKIRSWIKQCLAKFKKSLAEAVKGLGAQTEAGKTMQDAGEDARALYELWGDTFTTAFENSTARAEAQAVSEGVQYQVRMVDGKKVVWIEENILSKRNGASEHQFIQNYIEALVGKDYTILENSQKIYFGEDLPSEYTQSDYTRSLIKDGRAKLKARNRAAGGLGEMVEIATDPKWEETRNNKNKDAKYGMYKYSTIFAFPTYIGTKFSGVKAYRANLLIRAASDGKQYLYDVINIKKDDAIAVELYNQESRTRKRAQLTSSENNIAQKDTDVKPETKNTVKNQARYCGRKNI